MPTDKKYIFNQKTLSYEVARRPKWLQFGKSATLFVLSLGLAFFYFWIYTSVLHLENPKTILLKKANARLVSQIELLNKEMDANGEKLKMLQMRDDDIYRTIFGMSDIPASRRNSGIGGIRHYDYLDVLNDNSRLKNTVIRMDVQMKQAYVQTRSFDDVSLLSKRAGDMASCIPAILPFNPIPGTFRYSSSFGYRSDPFNGRTTYHSGVDFSMPVGTPIYATGDGVVKLVKFELFGYGNQLVIDHGFGYQTRYAHLKTVNVTEGMKVQRGECVALSGHSGRSTAPHLHYEVIYKSRQVNPYNYYDMMISPEEYSTMVKQNGEASGKFTLHPSHVKKK